MTARTNPHAARVRHHIDTAHRLTPTQMVNARARHIELAHAILDAHRVPNAADYRAQLASIETGHA